MDYEHVVKKLENIGFYNGSSYQKTLKNPEAKKVMEQKISDENPFLFARWGSVEGAVLCSSNDKRNVINIFTDFIYGYLFFHRAILFRIIYIHMLQIKCSHLAQKILT